MKQFKAPLLAILILLISNLAQAQVKKHALIVAIGNYPPETGWADISSLNDVPLIQHALEKQGFDDFHILKDEQATKKGILAEFDKLIRDCKPGDMVVVHISSHGQQIEDNNSDESDHLDEAIVAYGAPSEYDPLYHGENHLRDEELGAKLLQIREAIGPDGDLIVILDACHSGTGTRAKGKKRGGMPALVSPDFNKSDKQDEDVMMDNLPFSNVDVTKLSPVVVISASQADQVNFEYENAGSLSVAMSRSLENLNNETTYRELFSRVMKEMSLIAPNQTPSIEGIVDRVVFAGEPVVQENYYTVFNIRGKNLNLNGGQLTGIFEGTEVIVAESGTRSADSAEVLAAGSVISAEGSWSIVKLDKELKDKPVNYWVFVTKRSFGDNTVSVKLGDFNKKDFKTSISNRLSSSALIVMNDSPDFVIRQSAGNIDRVDLYRFDDGVLFQSNVEADELVDALANFAQGRFIKSVDLSDPDVDMSFEFVPVHLYRGMVDTSEKIDIKTFYRNGVLEVTEDDVVLIKVTNHGRKRAYYSIIDIQPDGVINPIIPDPEVGEDINELYIEPGDSHLIMTKFVEFGPPYGTEVFKLIAATEAIDFSPIITSRGEPEEKKEMSPFEEMFAESYSMGTRGGKVGKLSASDMSTFTLTFEIVKERQ